MGALQIKQAVDALQSSLAVGKKRLKKVRIFFRLHAKHSAPADCCTWNRSFALNVHLVAV